MKKLFALILALVMSLSLFACGSSKTKMRFVLSCYRRSEERR